MCVWATYVHTNSHHTNYSKIPSNNKQVGEAKAAYMVRAAALAAGIPHTSGASSVNRFCSSGLKAVQDIANQIQLGAIDVGIALGAELMSAAGDRLERPFNEEVLRNQEAADCM